MRNDSVHDRPFLLGRMIERAVVHEDPFRWVATPEVFDPAVAQELSRQFPDDALEWYRSIDEYYEKPYCMRSRTLHGQARSPRSNALQDAQAQRSEVSIPEIWSELVAVLCGGFYRDALSTLAEVDLSACDIEVRLCSYGADCWMGPHTDRSEKVATHIIYLTPDWSPDWGGALRLHRSRDENDVATVVDPVANGGVLIMRSNQSWHSVQRVTPGAPERRSILVHFGRRDA